MNYRKRRKFGELQCSKKIRDLYIFGRVAVWRISLKATTDNYIKAVAIDTNLLLALRAIDLLLTPTPSRDHIFLYCPVSILERYHT